MMISSKYRLGEQYWRARSDPRRVEKPCPVCFGKKQVVLILGNDERVLLPCEMCRTGFEPPKGFITVCEFDDSPELVTLTGIEVKITSAGEEFAYRYDDGFIVDGSCLFEDRESAALKGRELRKRAEQEQMEEMEFTRGRAGTNLTRNAGYHLQKAQLHRQKMEYHEARARLMQEQTETE